MSETSVFIYLGLGLFAFTDTYVRYIPLFIVFAAISVLVGRSHVFPICHLANKIRPQESRITRNEQIFLWYSGLRGTICFVIAIQLFDNPYYSLEFRKIMIATTLSVILFTLMILGIGTPLVIKFLGLRNRPGPGLTRNLPKENRNASLFGSMIRTENFIHLDRKFIKPFLCSDANMNEVDLAASTELLDDSSEFTNNTIQPFGNP